MTGRKRERLGQLQKKKFSRETNRELDRERPVIERRSGGDDISDHRALSSSSEMISSTTVPQIVAGAKSSTTAPLTE